MLLHQHPAFTYITWQGLIIVEYDPFDSSKVMQQYIISDDKTCDKYVYWDKQDPYILKTSNEWVTSNATTKLLFINDEGEGTEVPVEDIDYFYTNKGSSSGSVVSGKMLGMFNEIDGKFVSITEDIDGIRQTIGEITGEGGLNATTTERLNKLEQTVEGNTQTISEVKTKYEQNEEEEKLRNDVNVAFIDMMTILSEYERIISTTSKDLVIEDIEKIDIDNQKNKLIAQLSIINACHEIITERVKDVETLDEIERANVLLNDTVSGLNNHVTTIISGGKIDISDITTMLNYIADTSLKIKNYQGVLSDALLLGVGGSVISNIHTMTETSREYNRGITALEEVVNGETGLVETVESHGTWITQTSEDLSLKYVKYNETTAELTVSDETIKLDAGKVLMTGTLTWDSLDQDAKENLKGEDGTAEYITISGDQIIKYNENGDPNVESITLSAVTSNLGNLLFTWYYRDTNNTWVKITTTDIGEYIINHDDSIWENRDAITIRVSVTKDVITYYDDITLVKVRDGIDGTKNYVMVTGNQIFKYEDSFETTPTPMSLALTGTCYGFTTDTYSWYYENTSGEWIKIDNEVSNVLILPHTSPYFEGRETLTIKFEAGLYSDTITIAKLLDGSDGYYITLTNQAHVVPCDENGDYSSSDLENAKTEIHVYRGATEVGFSFSKVDKGCASIYNSSTKTLSLTRLTDDSATVTITITVNNKSFVKVMNIAKAKKGSMGEGLTVKGYFNSVDELPTTGNVVGDAYIIGTKLYVWSDKTNAWSDGIEFAGREGIPGKDGADGRTTYIHIKYSDDGKTFTSNDGETPGKWMGQYTDFIEQDSTDFSTYTWFKVQGEDGYNGIVANLTNDTHVIPCNADGSYGTDAFAGCITQITLSYNGTQIDSGVTYSYVKSNSILGTFTSSNGKFTATGWSDNSVTSGYVDMIANYEGVNYTKRFTIIKAKDGNDSFTINLSNDSHVFVANQSGDLIGETSVTINVTAYKGENKVTATIGTLPTVTGLTLSKSGETITIRASKTMATVGSVAIPITVGNISTQRYFNYSKVTCGNDGYTVMLTNESEIFNCASDGSIKETITKTTRVLAYKGTAQTTPTIGTLPTVTGLTLTKSGDTITIEANTGTSLAENGYFDIPITVDGVSFTKRFSWTKVRNGSAGDLPSWITDWNSNITTINNTSVISPKIFAGTVTNGVPTGVAIGKNVFGTSGTYSNVNGIVGYKNGTKNYEFNVNGDILIGNLNDQYISWTSSGLKVNANTITLNSQGVATSSQLEATQTGILSTVSQTYTTKQELIIKVEDENGKIIDMPITDAHGQLLDNVSDIKTEVAGEIANSEARVKDDINEVLNRDYATKTEFTTLEETVTSSISQTAGQIQLNFTETSKLISDIEGKVTEHQSELDKYIRFGINGIELGETNNSFKATLDNQKLAFLENGESVAFISNKALNITHANVMNSLQIGYFRFLPRNNGNLSFTWVTDSNVVSMSESDVDEIIEVIEVREIEEGDEE